MDVSVGVQHAAIALRRRLTWTAHNDGVPFSQIAELFKVAASTSRRDFKVAADERIAIARWTAAAAPRKRRR
jgi:hypothetical protein